MNIDQLWEIITTNSAHIKVINRELGSVMANVEWLTKAIGFLYIFIVGQIVIAFWNLVLTRRNGKK